MSISRIENPAKKSILKKEGGLPMINVKNIVSKAIKSFPKKSLELILVFAYMTTALGELFGQDYSWKWYSLLVLILAVFVVGKIVDSKPKEEINIAKPAPEEESNQQNI